MSYDQADALAAVGPTARASGIPRDIRADAPYVAYPDFPIKVITEKGGDLAARFVVRINELYESYRLVHEILDKLPVGELTTRVPRRIPENEVISRVEAPRGELFYYLKSNGSEKPERIKVRTPSICNWATVMNFAVGLKLADMPMILAGIDPCFSCSDRMVIINRKNQSQEWSWEDLRQYGIKYYR
jgi:NADH-quinone oxidoreductase subunit D